MISDELRISQSAVLALDDQRGPGQRQQGAYAVQRHTASEYVQLAAIVARTGSGDGNSVLHICISGQAMGIHMTHRNRKDRLAGSGVAAPLHRLGEGDLIYLLLPVIPAPGVTPRVLPQFRRFRHPPLPMRWRPDPVS